MYAIRSYYATRPFPPGPSAPKIRTGRKNTTSSFWTTAAVPCWARITSYNVCYTKLLRFEGMKMMNDMMKMNGQMNDMGMNMSLQQMDMNTVMYPEVVDSYNFV